MIKVAIFTEGQAEQLFACEAIKQLAGDAKYYVTNQRKNGKGEKLIKIDLGSEGEEQGHEIYFQILNCDSDSQVLSTIREEYETLLAAGFQHIIGVRDLYPLPRDKLENLLANIAKFAPKGDVAPLFVVSIMEVEAWFIAENNHFPKIDASLTTTAINGSSGIDITVDSETFVHPSETLHQIYQIAGKSYGKSKAEVIETVGALDMKEYDAAAGARAGSVVPLLNRIKEIFATA